MIFGSGRLLLCFVGSLLAGLCLLTQALCVWRGPDRFGGAEGGRLGPGIPSLALQLITALLLLPSWPRCHHWVTCQGVWPRGCSKKAQLKKGSCSAAKKRKLLNFSGQKGAENWDGKKDRKEIMQIKAHSDISQSYSKKA